MSHQRMARDNSPTDCLVREGLCDQFPDRRTIVSGILAAVLMFGSLLTTSAQPPDLATDLGAARRIFVPVEDLEVVVERDRRGVVLTKQKFAELLDLAKANSVLGRASQLPLTLTRGDYQARVAGDQLLLSVTAELTQFVEDWQPITFPMQRLAIEKATLDGEPAMLGRNADGSVSLLSPKKGTHTLQLELSTELSSQGSDQIAAFSLLRAPSGELSLTLPAGKRLLIGALDLERPAPIHQVADYKIAIGGAPGVRLRITDRATENSADSLMFATTGYGLHVAPGEVTWQALTTLQIFGKPIDRLTFSIPSGLEIADIESTGLEAWELKDDPANQQQTMITLTFGQVFDGARKILFKGVMAVAAGQTWSVPPLSIEKVTSHIGQVVVQYPAGVRLRVEETNGVRRATSSQQPNADMPDDLGKMNATEFLRFDVWQPDFVLRLTTEPKQREVQTAMAVVLDVNATGLDLQAIVTVHSHFAPLFELDVQMPADWKVIGAQRDKQTLRWQLSPQDAGVNQLRIQLDPPLASESSGTIRLSLRRAVEGWPVEAVPITVALPELFLPQSNLNEVTLVVRGDDDLDLSTSELTGLDSIPLKAGFERLRFQSQETRFGGKLKVTRKPSRIAAQTMTFGRLDPQSRHVFLQAMIEVQGGGVRTLKVALPESTGTALRFQSPIRQIVEQNPGSVANGERIWTLQFDQRVRGILPLFCDLELPRGATQEFSVPQARFVDAERQNGYLAVEAAGEQRLTFEAKAADGSPLAEVDALDLPEVFYVPKERVVAVFRTVTSGSTLQLSEERFDKMAVPTAICPLLDVTSVLGRTGELQHRATFLLTAVGVQGMRIILPNETSLWATLVDGQPVETRRQGDIYLIPLAEQSNEISHILQLFYQSKVDALTQFGTLDQPPPQLSVQTGQGTSQPVEILDQRWKLHYPAGTLFVSSVGSLEPDQKLDETSLLKQFKTGARIPTTLELGWRVLAVIVTLGVIALFGLAFRKGIRFDTAAVYATVTVIAGMMLYTFAAQEHSNSMFYTGASKGEYHAPPAAMHTRIQGMTDGVVNESRTMTEAEVRMSEDGTPPPQAPEPSPAEMTQRLDQEFARLVEEFNELFKQQRFVEAEIVAKKAKILNPKEPVAEQMYWKAVWGRRVADNEKLIRDRESSFWKQLDDTESAALVRTDEPEESPMEFRSFNRSLPRKQLKEQPADPAAPAPPMDALAQNQPLPEPAPAKADGKQAGERKREADRDELALLSLTLELTPPDGSLLKTFRYVGADTIRGGISLQLGYVDEHSGNVLRVFLVALLAAVGWFLRGTTSVTKVTLTALGLALPLALLPVVSQNLQVALDGCFFGMIAAGAVWVSAATARRLQTFRAARLLIPSLAR